MLKHVKWWAVALLFLYTVSVLWFSLFSRGLSSTPPHLELFWSYKFWLGGDWNIGKEILGNIALFVPFGFLTAAVTKKTRLLLVIIFGLILSSLIEISQLVWIRGHFEFDDIFNNVLGAAIGYAAYIVLDIVSGNQSAKVTILIGIICVVVGAGVCIRTEKKEIDYNRLYCFQVDKVETFEKEYEIHGFAFLYSTFFTFSRPEILLQSSGNIIKTSVEYGIPREDISTYFSDGAKYRASGFTAIAGNIDHDAEYEILVKWPFLHVYHPGVYLKNGRIRYGTERQYNDPGIDATFVTEGYLRVYRPDFHCWVYQYEGALYWVAGQDFNFEEDGLTYIQYQLWTTQMEKLPRYRLKNEWYWDNIGGNFEEYELKGDFGDYRVMRRELPNEYPITSILTGYYVNGKWIWMSYFRPVYEF